MASRSERVVKALAPFKGNGTDPTIGARARSNGSKPTTSKPTNGANPRGYTHYKPNPKDTDEVRRQVLLGATHATIAGCLGISVETLDRVYGDTLKFYQTRMLGQVAGTAYKQALQGNPFMVQFVLRTRARWKENVLSDE